MSIDTVKAYLQQYGLAHRIIVHEVSSATVELAAIALNCHPQRIAKTLSFRVNDKCILIVAAGDVKIDNAKYKAHFGVKAKMLPAGETLDLIGHEIGGICPFGIKEGIEVYLDNSLQRFNSVFPACGSHNSGIELTIDELEKYSNYKSWVDVCKII